MTTRFAHCHPDWATGLMWCQHHNGSWIAFAIGTPKAQNDETPSVEDEVSDENSD